MEARFWALNGIIGEADSGKIDLNKKGEKAVIARKIDLNVKELEEFITVLHEEAELIRKENGVITTDRVQEDLSRANGLREKRRERYEPKKNVSQDNQELSHDKEELSHDKQELSNDNGHREERIGGREDKTRTGEEQEEEKNPFEAEGVPPACACPDVREELKTAGFHFPKNDLESIEGYLKKHNLDAGYIRYVLSRMAENAKEKPIKNRVTYFRKAILWEDWRSGYREWQESERRSEAAERIRRARASPPKVCPVCGKPLTMTDTAVACKPCGKLWEFDEQRLVWREEKLYNPREVQEVVF
jgi:hypothetical protein